MRIVITGSPGTGKTSISEALSRRLGVPHISITKLVLENGILGPGREVDVRKLPRILAPLSKMRGYVVEGHLACETRIPADFVIVLRANPAALRRRLSKRNYGEKKLEGNILSELLDYCTQRARIVYGREPLELDTSGLPPGRCVSRIINATKQKGKLLDRVDFSRYLERHLRRRK